MNRAERDNTVGGKFTTHRHSSPAFCTAGALCVFAFVVLPLTNLSYGATGPEKTRPRGLVQPRTEPSASSGTPLTLAQSLRLALEHNPELRAWSNRVTAASGRALQARLWNNPELVGAVEDYPVTGGSFRDSKDTVGLNQTVPYPGKKKLDRQIGQGGVRVSEAEWALRRLELVREVKAAFYRVVTAGRLVDVANELATVAESSAATARKRVEAGASADQEQLRAEIQLEQARSELAIFERDQVAAERELLALMGMAQWRSVSLAGGLAEVPDLALLELPPERWLPKHPSVVSSRAARDRAELELRRARLELYPDVGLGVSGGREGPDNTGILEFRVGIPLPLLDRGQGKKMEAAANAAAAQDELLATEQRLLRDWEIVGKRFRVAAEQVSAYRDRILPKADRAFQLVKTGFEEGKFGFIDLLDTQRTAAEARLAYQQKLLELNLAQAGLEALVGTPIQTQ